ncbi:transposase [Pseudarthrobacter oxydans]|uniref:transposase n=1 Tax=Pseudarthrobacter oxydans TaxID=1671 RepID=UPI0035ECEC66
MQVVAIDPSAAFRKALRMWLPRTAVAVDHFHLISLANQAMTETRQNLSQQVKGRRGRAIDKAWAHRMLLLRGGERSAAGPLSGSRKSSPPMIRPALCGGLEGQRTAQAPAAHQLPGGCRRSQGSPRRTRQDSGAT